MMLLELCGISIHNITHIGALFDEFVIYYGLCNVFSNVKRINNECVISLQIDKTTVTLIIKIDLV